MKKLIAFFAACCLALPAVAAPKKDEKSREKDKKPEKEVPAMMWTVTVEGAAGETAAEEVKAFLSAMKDVKVESAEIKGEAVEAVISSKTKISRTDVSRALKEKKELKVKEFKSKRPDKSADKKDSAKADEKKPDSTKPAETKKEDPVKTEPGKTAPPAEKPKKE